MREAQSSGRVRVRAAYGFWPAAAHGNDIVVFDPQDHAREIARLPFPRQPDGEELCLADYLRPGPGGTDR